MIEMSYTQVCLETVDITDADNFHFGSDYARRVFLGEIGAGGLASKLEESIRERGFQAYFPDTSYHTDDAIHAVLPLALYLRWERGKYSVPMGNHRLAAARAVGLKKIPAYVQRVVKCTSDQLEEFKNIAQLMEKYDTYYQAWTFPGGTSYKGRDDLRKAFRSFRYNQTVGHKENVSNLPTYFYAGKSFLDIAMGTGFFAIHAGLLGATEVAGFDILDEPVEVAERIARAYKLPCKVDFKVSEFWDYPFDRQYDVVYANQCLDKFNCGHRSQCLGSEDDMLNLVCGASKRFLLAYMFFEESKPTPYDGGYYPSRDRLRHDLEKRGFDKIHIEKTVPPKTHVTALKKHRNVIEKD